MSVNNSIDSRRLMPADQLRNPEEKLYEAVNFPQTSPTRILDAETAWDSIPKWDVSHEGILPTRTAPPLGTTSTVESTLSVLANLKPDEARTDLYAILALIMLTANESRMNQRDIRHAGYDVLETLHRDAAQTIRDGAGKRYWGSIATGIGQIAGGALSVYSASSAFSLSKQAINMRKENAVLKDGSVEATAKALDNEAQAWTSLAQGGGQLPAGVGGLISAVYESKASGFDAQRADLEAIATKQEQMTNEVNEHMGQLLDMIRDVLEKLRSLDQSRSAVNSGISRNM